MAARKIEEAKPESVPIWYITYADMVTLLMALFVLLFSMSKPEQERIEQVAYSIREYFGLERGTNMTEGSFIGNSIYDKLRASVIPGGGADDGGTPVDAILGDNFLVETVEEGYKITIGGKVTFDEGSAALKPEAAPALDKLVGIAGGYYNKLEIRGHTSPLELAKGAAPLANYDLAYARARAAAEYMVNAGVDIRRIRLQSGGDYDRGESNLTYESAARNRRVEIIVSDELIKPVGVGGK